MQGIITYEEYLKNENALSIEEAERIYKSIVNQEIADGREFQRLFAILQGRAVEYAGYRAKWLVMSQHEKMEIDETRSRHHDLFIKAKNDLVKYMYNNKMNIDWDDELGEERKRIGDFACYMVFLMSLHAR